MGASGRILALARHELSRASGHADRRSVAIFLVLSVSIALLAPTLMERGLDVDRGLYRASVPRTHFLYPVIASSEVFSIVDVDDPASALDADVADLVVVGDEARALDSDKGRAALAALERAARAYTTEAMTHEADAGAAFPVRVNLVYVPQRESADSSLVPRAPTPAPSAPPNEPATGPDEEPALPTDDAPTSPAAPSDPALPPVGESRDGFDLFASGQNLGTPADLAPPFPFKSLILAYLFLIPMNFVVQVYASSMMTERLNRRGEPLLASPARPWEIVLGKTLPYAVLLLVVSAGLALFLGGSWRSVVAVLPIAFAFLALEFMAALLARSFRELTFLTVFASVFLTIYCFLPAVFSDVHPVSLISPISIVVLDLKGEAVTLAGFLYASVPLTLAASALFLMGLTLMRGEDLFKPRKPFERVLDALGANVTRLWSPLWLTTLLVPFAFLAELLLITFLFAWPFGATLPVILLVVAIVEESAKAAPAVAAFRYGSLEATPRRGLLLGLASGAGFFLMEKVVLMVSLAALLEVDAGAAVYGAPNLGIPVAILILMPLLLHVATAMTTSWGASQGKRVFWMTWVSAVLLHTLYNLAVVASLGGMG